MPDGAACAAAEGARLSLRPASRNLAEAVRWAANRENDLMRDGHPTHARGLECLALARVLIGQNRLAAAAALLDRMLASAEAGGSTGRVIETLVLQAITRQTQGDMAQAMLALARALSLGEPEGYVRVFLEEGAPVVRLLREAESRGIHRDYVSRLLTACGEPALSHVPVLVNPLSEREAEVLRLVAAGLSPQEIGKKLFIAIGTVRNHIKSIYGKLDAHSRLQAVNRAKALDLL
jgi:LuxR family maltose regulon positive regulatory protein